MLPQMDGGRNGMKVIFVVLLRDLLFYLGLRMASPGARMPTTPIGHPGPGGPMQNPYRPQVMSPSINQPGPRMYMTNSPGVKSEKETRHTIIFISIFRLDILHHHLFHMEYVFIRFHISIQ